MPDSLVRPALEAAWLLARATERTVPGSAPRSLRPLLGHARLTGAALRVVRRAVEQDDDFRAAVTAATTEDAVGRAGWLFLARPEGWEDELRSLVAAEAASAEAEQVEREERGAARRLRGTEEALRRAEVALTEARAQAARAASELADERRSRRAAETEAASLSDRLAVVERERAEAVARADELASRLAELEAVVPEQPEREVVPDAVLDVVADAMGSTQDAADRLGAALEALRSIEHRPPTEPTDAAPPAATRRPARRRPEPLPPGLRDDSVEAAEHLVRRRGALLLVDGYNASLRYRADLPIAELRHRFVDALDELAARTGVDVHVVFDGAGVVDLGAAGMSRRGRARVTFSPEDVEADDVILGLVDAVPLGRPVLVASDDRRVRDGVEQRGGNVLSTRQLLAVLRREPEP